MNQNKFANFIEFYKNESPIFWSILESAFDNLSTKQKFQVSEEFKKKQEMFDCKIAAINKSILLNYDEGNWNFREKLFEILYLKEIEQQ